MCVSGRSTIRVAVALLGVKDNNERRVCARMHGYGTYGGIRIVTAVRVRFAPSPTGHLHIGGARTAIYNWLFAQHEGGTFVLRIDDTDPERSTEEHTASILASLRWMGLDWDEGPEVGGAFGPYFQSGRLDSYTKAAEDLLAAGKAYRCYCTAEELERRREAALSEGRPPGYDRRCRRLSDRERAVNQDARRACTIRLAAPLTGETRFTDLVRGDLVFPNSVLDDYVLLRTDGTPTYNLASVVDDAAMRMTHIVRGDDHLSNTPRQIVLFEALGAMVPAFAHMPLTWGTDRKRLSKRHGATSVEAYRKMGYLPEAMLNYLTLLGWSLDDKTTFFTREELVRHFTLGRVSKNPGIFDPDKLEWMNGSYIRELDPADLAGRLVPFLEEAGLIDEDWCRHNRGWLHRLVPLVQERLKTLAEIVDLAGFFFAPTVTIDPEAATKALSIEEVPAILEAACEVVETAEPFETSTIEAGLRDLPPKLGVKPKVVFQAVRVALTGRLVSPPLFETIELLGRERTTTRLKAALEQLRTSR